jgi:hypothetical protein
MPIQTHYSLNSLNRHRAIARKKYIRTGLYYDWHVRQCRPIDKVFITLAHQSHIPVCKFKHPIRVLTLWHANCTYSAKAIEKSPVHYTTDAAWWYMRRIMRSKVVRTDRKWTRNLSIAKPVCLPPRVYSTHRTDMWLTALPIKARPPWVVRECNARPSWPTSKNILNKSQFSILPKGLIMVNL